MMIYANFAFLKYEKPTGKALLSYSKWKSLAWKKHFLEIRAATICY